MILTDIRVVMVAKVNISFRVQPWHYRALREEISKGKQLTALFEELLDERFPASSLR